MPAKTPRWYPAEDIPKYAQKGEKLKPNPPRIRKSITPGTVLILLAGRFRGKRVVCLKVLESGLLLVTGPYAINGVPLRRVNQAYVIATSTQVDLKGVNVKAFDDDYFVENKTTTGSDETEEQFFAGDDKPNRDAADTEEPKDQRKKDQDKVDAALIKTIGGTPLLKEYLAARFTLSKGDKPHEMIF